MKVKKNKIPTAFWCNTGLNCHLALQSAEGQNASPDERDSGGLPGSRRRRFVPCLMLIMYEGMNKWIVRYFGNSIECIVRGSVGGSHRFGIFLRRKSDWLSSTRCLAKV